MLLAPRTEAFQGAALVLPQSLSTDRRAQRKLQDAELVAETLRTALWPLRPPATHRPDVPRLAQASGRLCSLGEFCSLG